MTRTTIAKSFVAGFVAMLAFIYASATIVKHALRPAHPPAMISAILTGETP